MSSSVIFETFTHDRVIPGLKQSANDLLQSLTAIGYQPRFTAMEHRNEGLVGFHGLSATPVHS